MISAFASADALTSDEHCMPSGTMRRLRALDDFWKTLGALLRDPILQRTLLHPHVDPKHSTPD
jgi:hypothetical protein